LVFGFWWFRHLDAMENVLEKSWHGRHTGFHPEYNMLLLFFDVVVF